MQTAKCKIYVKFFLNTRYIGVYSTHINICFSYTRYVLLYYVNK